MHVEAARRPKEFGHVVAIGVSADGVHALETVLRGLPPGFGAPVIIVQHRSPAGAPLLASILARRTGRIVTEARSGEPLETARVYVAPPDSHLVVEDGRAELLRSVKVRFARPSIDVLFESVATVYGRRGIGVLLSGFGSDGAQGLQAIRRRGGTTVVQDPAGARAPHMPRAALAADGIDLVLPLREIGPALARLVAVESIGPGEAVVPERDAPIPADSELAPREEADEALRAELGRRLEEERRSLFETIVASDDELDALDMHEAGAFIEDAARDSAGVLLARVEGQQKHELDEIDEALERLRTGAYGRCEDCGQLIPLARLRAAPAVRRCVACQTQLEAR